MNKEDRGNKIFYNFNRNNVNQGHVNRVITVQFSSIKASIILSKIARECELSMGEIASAQNARMLKKCNTLGLSYLSAYTFTSKLI